MAPNTSSSPRSWPASRLFELHLPRLCGWPAFLCAPPSSRSESPSLSLPSPEFGLLTAPGLKGAEAPMLWLWAAPWFSASPRQARASAPVAVPRSPASESVPNTTPPSLRVREAKRAERRGARVRVGAGSSPWSPPPLSCPSSVWPGRGCKVSDALPCSCAPWRDPLRLPGTLPGAADPTAPGSRTRKPTGAFSSPRMQDCSEASNKTRSAVSGSAAAGAGHSKRGDRPSAYPVGKARLSGSRLAVRLPAAASFAVVSRVARLGRASEELAS
mmetsp:Transcript_2667/g.8121  ORF Transcript_2667/g.8121 Transcript_2667/m.8121 type:complete len:272 (-) Transcript_2667:822-1637(-)